ncbi:MAG: PQQ-binding-like beta-propeller repeat protein [Planctomycetota bacterium]|jgi:outer membrane protein assembly factor BamB
MKSKLNVMLSLMIVLTFVSVCSAADWPNWRGPDYNGISTETDWNPAALNTPNIAWKADIGTGYSTVSIADGKAYCAGNINKNTDVIYCFDAETGKEIWTYKYPEPLTPKWYDGGCSATPAIHEGKLYHVSKTGKIFCLDAETSKEIWKTKLPYEQPTWGFASSAVIVDDLVLFNAGAAGIAYNKKTGNVVWESPEDIAGYASPVPFVRNEVKYVALFCKDTLKVVEALTGKVTMSYDWETDHDVNAADPIVAGDEILITSGYGHGAALLKIEADELKLIWQNKNLRSQMSGPVLIDGIIYGIDSNRMACLDWKTGERKWVEKAPRNGALSAAGDKVIVIGEKGKLFILQASPDGFKELSSAQVLPKHCWAVPVLSNGRIYVRNGIKDQPDTLICVDVRK